MSGVSLEIKIDDVEIQRALEGLLQAGQDLTPAMDEAGSALVTSILMNFENETDPDGNKWLPSIRAREEGGLTLSDKGHLANSITHIAGNEEVEAGTNVPYAAVHQGGAVIKAKTSKGLRFKIGNTWSNKQSVTIPKRQFIGIGEDDKEMLSDILRNHLERVLQ